MPPVDRASVQELIVACTQRVAGDLDERWEFADGDATPLMGNGGLSSLTVVALMVEVEQEIGDMAGHPVTLSSDSLMSTRRSPLATVGSFTDFVVERLAATP